MHRCLQLAKLGEGNVAPNPMVGAILVYENRIIGEGYHQQYGQAHAEVNCINSVHEADQSYIEKSTLYVSLEPCAHYGKTPPCADLIILKNIAQVVIGCRDSYEEVNGRGIEKLLKAGVEVIAGILEKEALDLNKRFFTFYTKMRPYIILKWAQSKNGLIAKADYTAVKISDHLTDRLVHKWRSEEAAIMIGTNTALYDNPSLTNRLWMAGNNPVRLVIDKHLRLPETLHLFDGSVKTVVFNFFKQEKHNNVLFYKLSSQENIISAVLKALYELKIQSVLIEGGAVLLQSFIDADCWDEARIITNETLMIDKGIKAPQLTNASHVSSNTSRQDVIAYFKRLS